jgi:hypothetical protein
LPGETTVNWPHSVRIVQRPDELEHLLRSAHQLEGDFPYYDRWFLEGLPDRPREVWRELYSGPPVLSLFRERSFRAP